MGNRNTGILDSFAPDPVVVIVGAGGGIGAALADAVPGSVVRLTRGDLDLTDEAGIACAAAGLKDRHGTLDLVIVATGLLHGAGITPEKTWTALDPGAMARAFQVNTIGPALVAKHFLPLLARDRKSGFAALSARVGSIGDNRLGGWMSYRASKAALNQVIRTLSVELARKNPKAFCVGLHPGTVDTGLSQPYQGGARHEIFSPGIAADHLLRVLDDLTPEDTGKLLAWDGAAVPF